MTLSGVLKFVSIGMARDSRFLALLRFAAKDSEGQDGGYRDGVGIGIEIGIG